MVRKPSKTPSQGPSQRQLRVAEEIRHIIAGILKADEGDCQVLGTDLARLRSRDLLDFRARHVGFIFQQFHLLPSLSVADNVAVPLIINGRSRTAALASARY